MSLDLSADPPRRGNWWQHWQSLAKEDPLVGRVRRYAAEDQRRMFDSLAYGDSRAEGSPSYALSARMAWAGYGELSIPSLIMKWRGWEAPTSRVAGVVSQRLAEKVVAQPRRRRRAIKSANDPKLPAGYLPSTRNMTTPCDGTSAEKSAAAGSSVWAQRSRIFEIFLMFKSAGWRVILAGDSPRLNMPTA
jgi:hypothetical protein